MNKYEYIAQLFHKSWKGTLSRKEKKDLKKWLALSPENKETYDRLTRGHAMKQLEQYERSNPDKSENLFAIDKDVLVELSGPAKKYRVLPKAACWALAVAVAACIILIVSTRRFVYSQLPGFHNMVQLQLADGTQILPDTVNGYLLMEQGNCQLLVHNREIRYMALPGNLSGKRQAAFNEVRLPAGKLFTVVLPDNSKVLLNAVSSIRFSVSNPGGSIRHLELTGEGYFEVQPVFDKKGKIPFKVTAKTPAGLSQDLVVTGTTFNINAYGDESVIKTSLFEGSVRVSCNGEVICLLAGEELVAGNFANNKMKSVGLRTTTAWKNGSFSFSNASLQSVLDEVGRWYGMHIELKDDISGRISLVHIPRLSKIESVLSTICDVVKCDYKIDGGQVILRKR